ncbi:ArsC family reductase [Candidatus Thioglobus autotrophicus]|uniref:ArsC family reductase n=1 Tax=Candidatus Thioglobus autotrophicus TaxID=1705394 RepID=UPI00299CDFC4|nr:ArsC family reductase [Candidatus Thioglobus autotrophicus]WPE16953.1 ArsC family reductase [Candidatus Thioglobus autotrophicus]
MITMYGIKNCDTIKKARRFLEDHQVEFEFIDFRQQPIEPTLLQSFVDQIGWDKLINKRSTTYRSLSDAQKANITLELTLKNPTLIKRPVLVTDGSIRVGFSEKSYSDLV